MAKRVFATKLLLGAALSGALVLSALSPATAALPMTPEPVPETPPTEELSTADQPEEAGLFSLAPMSTNVPVGGLWGDTSNRRLGGQDRYETAVRISNDTYPTASTVQSVVVTTGLDFPDSLSAAPFAAKLRAPLLMTHATSLSIPTLREIERLQPNNIYVIGGTGAVSSSTEAKLRSLLPRGGTLTRIGGVDRYETSVKIAEVGWSQPTQSEVFVATGTDFPDALSAGAAAGAIGAPVILVPGANTRVGPQTRQYLTKKKTSTVHIVGGPAVVSDGISRDVNTLSSVRVVKRYQGADRYLTSASVANQVFSEAASTFLANGMEFPDALTGAAAAGALGAPLLLTRKDCIPTPSYDANDRLLPQDTVLLGESGVLAATVQHGNECMTAPRGATTASVAGMQLLYAEVNKARFNAGLTAFRLADSKVGNPAYTWAANRKLARNSSLSSQHPWVRTEAVARSSAAANAQVKSLYNMFITDTKNGTRNAILRTYGGVRPYISVGYISGSTGYAALHVGTTPK